MVSDALLPVEYTTGRNWEAADFKGSFPPEVQQAVNEKWILLGY